MTKHYNKRALKPIRRKLRQNQTYAEKVAWFSLRSRNLLGLKFKRQYSVDKFVIDFYCAEYKLALEIDGSVHDLPENVNYDESRQKYLEDNYGISFIRIKNEELLGNPNMAWQKAEEEIKRMINGLG